MIILKNEENEETTVFEFSDCKKDKVFVDGLQEGFFIISEAPYYFQNENGLMVGIDNSFTEFKVYNENNEIVEILEITWIDKCSDMIECSQITYSTDNLIDNSKSQFADGIPFLFLIIIFIVLMIIQRKKD